ncbi:uncharacterized protein LOC131670712 isoform X2 [Phymastichus coffea]|nr:uncharacterized protein LOC131670712 isoform X2 [Phymastichus coffea]XP_058802527.1 uncharacterized protein LOC131670712 isoform X2 [Phymastichus coffea]XP_058802528.1 uncharacterized protein LOC131670712 isoform X2 [Phymastichus coffea]XP_058802529.1 uncharacterized protein LOC131670712 isoform X2 [Phymastichus coffea]
MEQDQESKNGVESGFKEMSAALDDVRNQEIEMKNHVHQPAEMHEIERKRWHEECQKMHKERDRLLKQGAEKPKPKVAGLRMSSRVIGSSKTSSSASHTGNRMRNFNEFPDGFKKKLLEMVRQKHHILATSLQRQRQALENDDAARILNGLSISERSDQPRPVIFPQPKDRERLRKKVEANLIENENLTIRRRLQQQLSSVLHAQTCQSRKTENTGIAALCYVPFCSVTNKLLEHIRTCTFVTKCPTPMCSLTREALEHYKNCTTDSCDICHPAKRESIASQEQLLKFMEMVCKRLTDDNSVETPSVSNILIPRVNPILNPDPTGMPSLPKISSPILPGTELIPIQRARMTHVPVPIMINPTRLCSQTPGAISLSPFYDLPSISIRPTETQTEEASAETMMEGSDEHK